MSTDDLHERLFSKCVWTEAGCLVFMGARNSGGYGHIRYGASTIDAHRAAYLVCVGDIPEGLHVLHKRHCTSRACCNPEHLYAGTNQDNCDDKVALGRQGKGKGHACALLTADEVQEARRMILQGVPIAEIGRRLGVSENTIHSIKQGRSWAWLSWPDPDEVPKPKPRPSKLPWHPPVIHDITPVHINRRGL